MPLKMYQILKPLKKKITCAIQSHKKVIQQSKIRLILIIARINRLKSCQVDYVQAFLKATLNNEDVFMPPLTGASA
eukprot:4028324-Ditylum_brightwellii.AAC.1